MAGFKWSELERRMDRSERDRTYPNLAKLLTFPLRTIAENIERLSGYFSYRIMALFTTDRISLSHIFQT